MFKNPFARWRNPFKKAQAVYQPPKFDIGRPINKPMPVGIDKSIGRFGLLDETTSKPKKMRKAARRQAKKSRFGRQHIHVWRGYDER